MERIFFSEFEKMNAALITYKVLTKLLEIYILFLYKNMF